MVMAAVVLENPITLESGIDTSLGLGSGRSLHADSTQNTSRLKMEYRHLNIILGALRWDS
jgi:hypothetical protein